MLKRRISKATSNERFKLAATTLNAVGLAFLGLGVLGPMLSGRAPPMVQVAGCFTIFLVLHITAHLLLRALED